MLLDPALVRQAYERALDDFQRVVVAVGAEEWDRPSGCGAWSIRELVAHARRAATLPGRYLAATSTSARIITDAVEYYQVALSVPDAHEQIARRAREAAEELRDPLGELEVDIPHGLAEVAGAADDDPVHTPFGQMALIDYLATRVVELVVHTIDLAGALREPVAIHPAAAEVTLEILVRLGPPAPIIAALTGRRPLPEGFDVLS